MQPPYSVVRVTDHSFGGTCPSCASPLPRVVRLSGETEEKVVEFECRCGFQIAFMGQGLIRDRRRSLTGLDERLSTLRHPLPHLVDG